MFIQLIDDFFKIDDWMEQEIHATDIWNRKHFFSRFSESQIKDFFEELLQLLCKLHTPCIFGMSLKSLEADKDKKRDETAKAIYSFLHNLEYFLSREKETGLIISDIIDSTNNQEKNPLQRQMLDKLLYERMMWRINPKANIEPLIASRYKFESRSCFLLDNIHYVHSKHSIFIQILDVVIYTFMRVFTYLYLDVKPGIIVADIKKVPITINTFAWFARDNITLSYFYTDKKDVSFMTGEQLLNSADETNFMNLQVFENLLEAMS